MIESVYCPQCRKAGRKPKLLAKYEKVEGRCILRLWCKNCRQEITIMIEDNMSSRP